MVIPPIEPTPDGWSSQRWQVRFAAPVPHDLEQVGRELEEVTLSVLQSEWAARGEKRSDPVRVTCRPSAGSSVGS
jgi:hypothetical protein